MRNVSLLAIAILLALASCKSTQKSKSSEYAFQNDTDTISYIIGADVGNNLTKNMIDINIDAFLYGLNSALALNDTVFSQEETQMILNNFQKKLQEKAQALKQKEAEDNMAKGKAFLDENRKKDGIKETSSGLQYMVIREGTGKNPSAESRVTVNYEGRFIDGVVFDSSYDRGEPATFPLNGVIEGWTEGLQLMKEGAMFEFYIPDKLAYGPNGAMTIPGGSTLIFKVELIKVE